MATSGKGTGNLALVVAMVLAGALCAHAILEIDPKGPTVELKATFITFVNQLKDAVKCTLIAPLLGKDRSVVVPPGKSRTIRKDSAGTATKLLQRNQLQFTVCGVVYNAPPAPALSRVGAVALIPTITFLAVGDCEGKPGLKYSSVVLKATAYVACARPATKSKSA